MSNPLLIDKRSSVYRRVRHAWRTWDVSPPGPVRAAESLTGAVLRKLQARRLRSRGVPPKRPFLVSVGNLSMGGTGKTPVVMALAEGLLAAGVKVAVLTRGYGSQLSGPLLVGADDRAAGDEARLMAGRLPACPVIQARRRPEALAMAVGMQPVPDIILLEDGHQTGGLPRHLDIVILDRWTVEQETLSPQTGLTMPWGHYREDFRGAARAEIWLLESDDAGLRDTAPQGHEVVTFGRRLDFGPELRNAARQPWGIVSGIGRPEVFEEAMSDEVSSVADVVVRYGDHHAYSPGDVAALLEIGRTAGVKTWMTTEKDAVKLAPLWPDRSRLHPVPMSIVWTGRKTLPDLVGERLRGE